MAAIEPTDLFTGYSLLAASEPAPSQGIFIPLTSLAGLTQSEAEAVTGDGRKVAFELCRTVFNTINTLASADRPAKMTVSCSTPSGVDSTTVRQAYTMTFDLDMSNSDVAAES